jgi:integrase
MAMCLRLSRHIADEDLRREWVAFGLAFGAEANRRGDLKMKERSLSARPVTLEGLCWIAVDMLHKLPEQTDVQARRRRSAVLGALRILLFYPLRKGELLRLRFHHELIRAEGKWRLSLHATQKTNEYLPPLVLPAETTPFIDLALTNGAPLHTVGACYAAAKGQHLISSPRSSGAYNPSAFTSSFSELVGQPPHTLRTIWCDELIARGADRMTVKVMLQHKRLLSQEEYEVMAQKIRRNRALEALRSFSQEL